MTETTFDQAYPIVLRAVRARAISAIATGAIPVSDREDMEQEGLTACWRALPRYDSTRSSLPTFVDRVVTTRIASVIRATRRKPSPVSLDFACCQADPGVDPLTFYSDAWRMLSLLNEDDLGFVRLLMEETPTEVSRTLGVARSTVYARIGRLRRQFVAAGFAPNGGRR